MRVNDISLAKLRKVNWYSLESLENLSLTFKNRYSDDAEISHICTYLKMLSKPLRKLTIVEGHLEKAKLAKLIE
jgi:hypothetical protein